MKVNNLKQKLESIGATVNIKAEEARWGGWNITMTCRLGGYYDIEVTEQVHHTLDVRIRENAIDVFLVRDIDYFAAKPWHDESDPMTDYCAWSFWHKLKDVDYLMQNTKGRRLAPAV